MFRRLLVITAGLLALLACSSAPDSGTGNGESFVRGSGAMTGCPGADTRYPATSARWHGKRTKKVTGIVIHALTGWYDSTLTDMWQHNSDNPGTAAHYVVSRAGVIAQAVSDDYVAYHVRGTNFFQSGASNNEVTIGIEHEDARHNAQGKTVTYEQDPNFCTDVQYRASARLAAWLARTYSIPVDAQHIVGHVDVPNNTHGDPGRGFDMDYYLGLVNQELGNASDAPCASDAANAQASDGNDDDPPDPGPSGATPDADCSNDGVAQQSGWYDASLIGTACANDGQCNPCRDGSGLMCGEDGTCGPGCRSDAQCHGDDTCDPDAQECGR
jgi:N-acetyl-anhydromuramyl-L-alanine amidase AmpD